MDHTHECRRCGSTVECGYSDSDCQRLSPFEGYCDECEQVLAADSPREVTPALINASMWGERF